MALTADDCIYDRRQLLQRGTATIATLFAAGCGARQPKRIAVLPKTTSIDYWENLRAGAQQSASEFNLRIIWNAPQSETNFAQQALMLEDFIHARVDGIVLAPSHGSVLASAVRHAKAEHIPLVVVDSPVMVDSDEFEAYIGSDPGEIASLAAERMGTVLEGHGEVAVLGVSPTVQAAVERERAFTHLISSRYPGIKIIGMRYALADAVRAREIAADLLRENPNLAAFFASDSFSVRGALIALRSHKGSNPKLIGVAQEEDLLYHVGQGHIDALVIQDSYAMGRAAVRILGSALKGGYRDARNLQTRVALATRENMRTATIQELTSRRPVA